MLWPSLRCHCGYFMQLPCSSPQEKEVMQSSWTPRGILLRNIACLQCGRVSSYSTRDVRWVQVPQEGHSPDGGNVICWCIETACDEELCDLPIEFHILSRSQKGQEEVRFSMLRLFEKRFLRGLTCGRGHPPGKSGIRAVRKVDEGLK